ncbi:nicotinate phosphoribosyltransferase [Alkalilimnicola ehrlichii]|uniref:Nicotinate phosphoribosyltransferase n=1 Tax=Alkalilimnicola ehrlichii TaxID=351052 RepID=A0A3E0X3A1_9GAMM|nr:nicotinate phosphoribosyltransferase [Alkalilimnicola ehrlichii]RFA25131.1 nicotinate phosphoribosyltransferase [Alkalilimnicola ehrlichii]RFA38797.1 nicotinate phosphoribosyltransferase [Alkalilimnicola ehrlichii]
MRCAPFLSGRNAALFTDLYELKMAQAFLAEGMRESACFSLFFRRLPACRNYILACGVEDVLPYLESLRFSDEDIQYLASLGQFSDTFLAYLADFRFTGDVYAVPEGTPVFPQTPIIEVVAPVIEAQLIETWVMNQVHVQSVLASKAARVVEAAAGRPVLEFGARRIHGADGALKAARAGYIAGVAATSNVLAGRCYAIPVAGTMAHSYIQAHESEQQALRAFVREFPSTVLLVDTYDTLRGIDRVIELAKSLGADFNVQAVRIDSGDLAELAMAARRRLDDAGLQQVQIIASGGLDEQRITALLAQGAPIDGFGVGTAMGASVDAPTLDMAYKLVEYAGRGRLKLSTGKQTLPGQKQVFRQYTAGVAQQDVIGRWGERLPGMPLLQPVMLQGRRVGEEKPLPEVRSYAREMIESLPPTLRRLTQAPSTYPVALSDRLQGDQQAIMAKLRASH